jgi:plastocyanin
MRRAGLGVLALAALLLVLPVSAEGANRRISISDYQWSDSDINLDLGEHATWYWTGPDTMHSVTGQPPNASQWDSDPGSLPQHNIGDNYQLTFDQPGIYHFQCKIHSLVAGTVVVSNNPGDPDTEPDPVPKSNVDLKAPKMRGLELAKKFGPDGSPLRYSLNEAGKLDVEYYRLSRKGKERFAGWATYKAYVGYNRARIGERKPHFKPKSGRYVAKFRVMDKSNNTSKAKQRSFRLW